MKYNLTTSIVERVGIRNDVNTNFKVVFIYMYKETKSFEIIMSHSPVRFYELDKPYGEFSNFYSAPFVLRVMVKMEQEKIYCELF